MTYTPTCEQCGQHADCPEGSDLQDGICMRCTKANAQAEHKAAYYALCAELADIEARTGLYLADENVDAENAIDAGLSYGSAAFWEMMIDNATMNAGSRAENAGQNINELIGRVIY